MFWKRTLLTTLVAISIWSPTTFAHAAEAASSVEVLPDLGGGADAYAINDRGDIVGHVENLTRGITSAALWRDSQLIELGTLGGKYAVAYAINNKSEVVGLSYPTTNNTVHAFLWKNGAMIDLGCLPGGNYCEALDINNSGDIVGRSDDANGIMHAVKWSRGRIIDLQPNTTENGIALSINDSGVAGGFVERPDGTLRATVWDGKRQRHFDEFASALVRGINNHGSLLIEQYTDDQDEARSVNFYLVRGDNVTNLTYQNNVYFVATALNNRDQVSGWLMEVTPEQVVERVVLWEKGQVYQVAPVPQPFLSGKPRGLNDRGQQVGFLYTGTGLKAAVWKTTTK